MNQLGSSKQPDDIPRSFGYNTLCAEAFLW